VTGKAKRPALRVVYPPKRAKILPEDFQEPTLQYLLFPTHRQGVLIFMHFPDVTEEEFRDTLQYANPSFVLELRFSPRFDIGRLNRRLAFQTFQKHNTTYSDLTSSLMGEVDLEEVLFRLKNFLETVKPSFDRPIVFLTNRNEFDKNFMKNILETVSSFSSAPSNVYEVPNYIAR
jgi:hypothetical protein